MDAKLSKYGINPPKPQGGRDLYTLYSVYTLLTLPQTIPSSPQGTGDLYTVYSAYT